MVVLLKIRLSFTSALNLIFSTQDSSTPYPDVRGNNFTGCIEEIYLGPDRVELSAGKEGAHGVEAGCTAKVMLLDNFSFSYFLAERL